MNQRTFFQELKKKKKMDLFFRELTPLISSSKIRDEGVPQCLSIVLTKLSIKECRSLLCSFFYHKEMYTRNFITFSRGNSKRSKVVDFNLSTRSHAFFMVLR